VLDARHVWAHLMGNARAADRTAPQVEALCDSQTPCQGISRTHLPDSRAKAAAAPPAPVPSTVRAPAAVLYRGEHPRRRHSHRRSQRRSQRHSHRHSQRRSQRRKRRKRRKNQTKQQPWADQDRTCERSLVLPRT